MGTEVRENTENFIRIYDALPHDFCSRVVDLFEANIGTARQGGTVYGLELNHKVSLDIDIRHGDPIWGEIDTVFQKSTREIVDKYMEEFADCFAGTTPQLGDSGYTVRRYEKGTGFFGMHSDVNGLKSSHRILALIWYLNTVEEGGETTFKIQKVRVKPEIGKVLVFPTNWTHLHAGEKAVSDHKYMVRTFLTYRGI